MYDLLSNWEIIIQDKSQMFNFAFVVKWAWQGRNTPHYGWLLLQNLEPASLLINISFQVLHISAHAQFYL